jgi:hypothetical protein
MAFLSLAKGTPAVKSLLQKAIRARYGIRPVMIETLRLGLTGVRKNFLGLPVQISAQFDYVANSHGRWQQTDKPMFGKAKTFVESYDGGAFYQMFGKKANAAADLISLGNARRRLLAELALLLTPLTGEDIVLTPVNDHAFSAALEAYPDENVTIYLNPDDTVNRVEAQRVRYGKLAPFVVRPDGGIQTLNLLLLPVSVAIGWADQRLTHYKIISAEMNTKLPLTNFTLEVTKPEVAESSA